MNNDITYNNKITVEEYYVMRESAGWFLPENSQAEQSLNNSMYIITARDNNKIVGMARLVGDGAYFTLLVDVIVLPEYQGQKIGSTMVENILTYVKNKRKKGQYISVQLREKKVSMKNSDLKNAPMSRQAVVWVYYYVNNNML